MVLNDNRFTTKIKDDDSKIIVYYGENIQNQVPVEISGDYIFTVTEISESNPPFVKISWVDADGFTHSGWTMFDFNNLTGGSLYSNLVTDTEDESNLQKAKDAYSEYTKLIADKDAVNEYTRQTNNPTTTSGDTYETAVTDADGDIIVSPSMVSVNYSNSIANTQVENIVRSFGVPPQYNCHVDPRILVCNYTGLYGTRGARGRLGRRFLEVTISNPTVVEIAPGYVYFNNKSLQNNGLTANDIYETTMKDIVKNDTGSFFTIKPCFKSIKHGSKNVNGYMSYVNVLCRVAAVYMSRNSVTGKNTYYYKSGDTVQLDELQNRPMPIFNTKYRYFDWEGFDVSDSGIIVGSSYLGYQSAEQDQFTYIKFFTVQGTNTNDNFSISTGQSTIESSINGALSGVLKDAAFILGGIVGGGIGDFTDNVNAAVSQAIGGTNFAGADAIASLLHSTSEFITGGKIVFPEIIEDCSYGKEQSVECVFPSIYGDNECNYLNCMVPLMHVLAFCLPHQVQTVIDIYTYPFLVKAFIKGQFSCGMGVLTDLRVSRGGDSNDLWSYDSNPTEIKISFNIKPLISKLVITSSMDGPKWFLKNQGLQEYLAALCGVDLRNNRMEMMMEIYKTLFQGQATAFFNNLLNSFMEKTGIDTLINFGRMVYDYFNRDSDNSDTLINYGRTVSDYFNRNSDNSRDSAADEEISINDGDGWFSNANSL